MFPETQRIVCGICGRGVLTPKGAAGYFVQCGTDACQGKVEAIPF